MARRKTDMSLALERQPGPNNRRGRATFSVGIQTAMPPACNLLANAPQQGEVPGSRLSSVQLTVPLQQIHLGSFVLTGKSVCFSPTGMTCTLYYGSVTLDLCIHIQDIVAMTCATGDPSMQALIIEPTATFADRLGEMFFPWPEGHNLDPHSDDLKHRMITMILAAPSDPTQIMVISMLNMMDTTRVLTVTPIELKKLLIKYEVLVKRNKRKSSEAPTN